LTCIYNVYTFNTMNFAFELQGQVFEWDTGKAAANLRKHRVSFESACQVFFDPFVRLMDASPQGEAREAAIGLNEDWTLLFVVHVIRHGNIIRMISAQTATASERREYEYE
jgi:uncharacterized protein